MSIRRFAAGDEAALHRVFLSAIHETASRDYTLQQVCAWAPVDLDAQLWAARMQGIQPFVAEQAGFILGYADVQANGYIDHFFVAGSASRRGVGRLLMERIHEEARTLRLAELTSDVSLTAEPFFAHFGFAVVERRMPVMRGVPMPNALMHKPLRQVA
ncbi:MAG: GNAT family N-acetyltransferase [Pseudomonadota bacterium]